MTDKNNGTSSSLKSSGKGSQTQPFGTIVRLPIGLPQSVCQQSVDNLNQLLADTMSLRDLYKKHHWQVSGQTFYSLHLLFDKHYEEQAEMIDAVAERIMMLGGVSVAMAADVAEMTRIARPPKDREPVEKQLARLLEAHEIVLKEARDYADAAADAGDDGTNDLIVGSVIRPNEMQVWFISQHLVDATTPGGDGNV